ncbi:hypothetical protein [Solibaculum intestinale]|uniref:Uncharacterized protein n=1 Tax=Solibaculum intestinale TaxID=3133165 RepID=A0ABV1DWC9_9FIRM
MEKSKNLTLPAKGKMQAKAPVFQKRAGESSTPVRLKWMSRVYKMENTGQNKETSIQKRGKRNKFGGFFTESFTNEDEKDKIEEN